MDEVKEICQRFFKENNEFSIRRLEGGHINDTFKISYQNGTSYILQALNRKIFNDPQAVMDNIQFIADHLKKTDYPLEILEPIASKNGLLERDSFGNYWRAFPFFEKTTVYERVSNPDQAYVVANSFGLFIKHLDGIDLANIRETISNFHDLNFRFDLFEKVVKNAKPDRIEPAISEIGKALKWRKKLNFDFTNFPLRVVHNDAKISNVLLDQKGEKGVCVIDLDTVMSGFAVTDFGDMVRTMCCSASEEETNIEKVSIDIEIFKETAKGFLTVTNSILTKDEKENLISGCVYIIFEQAIRFLTDYLDGDKYYQISYPDQNLNRARNQLKLLESFNQNISILKSIVIELF